MQAQISSKGAVSNSELRFKHKALDTRFRGNDDEGAMTNQEREGRKKEGNGDGFFIGAFKFQWPANRISDFDRNLRMDHLDLFMFAPSWEKEMDTPIEMPNLNNDFVINALDLLVLMKDWREATGT